MTTRMSAADFLALVSKKPTKFRNIRRAATALDQGSEYTSPLAGRRVYDSKAEARRAAELDTQVQAGLIRSWVAQVSFPLPHTHRRMQLDFLVVGVDGSVWLEDVKGAPPTPAWLHKRDVLQNAYGLRVEIIRGRR